MEGATSAVDLAIDGKILDDTKPMIYSVLNNEAYVIQGKALPFNDEDIVPVGLKVLEAGNYNIAIETFDGLFDTQNVYLKDNQLNIIHDLKQSPYDFTSAAGVFENRFELVYKSTLSQDEVIAENHVSIYSNEQGIQVSSSKTIQEVVIYDVLGRVLYQDYTINKENFTIQSILKANQALIVKVKDNNGVVKTEKVIY
ncbi:MAG: T9SS sorting signal type C domain-containing protein [Flavobacteriaceae bacterium]|nr:T9SS sorting signal type C domain-containing protein [Flavobacteriaceae bacterium]